MKISSFYPEELKKNNRKSLASVIVAFSNSFRQLLSNLFGDLFSSEVGMITSD